MPTLHWLTRDEDLRTASRVPYRLLEEAPELSAGEPDTGNMLIQGDKPGSAQGVAAVLRRAGEVHLYRPAVQHGRCSLITTTTTWNIHNGWR